jgi:hypothetical protein
MGHSVFESRHSRSKQKNRIKKWHSGCAKYSCRAAALLTEDLTSKEGMDTHRGLRFEVMPRSGLSCSQFNTIVHRFIQLLLAPYVAFRSLHRDMPE